MGIRIGAENFHCARDTLFSLSLWNSCIKTNSRAVTAAAIDSNFALVCRLRIFRLVRACVCENQHSLAHSLAVRSAVVNIDFRCVPRRQNCCYLAARGWGTAPGATTDKLLFLMTFAAATQKLCLRRLGTNATILITTNRRIQSNASSLSDFFVDEILDVGLIIAFLF